MKNKFFAYYLIGLALLSCSSQKVTQSLWHDQQYEKEIAGKLKYDTQSGLMYGISNDSENLYVDLRVSDRVLQRKIFSLGLTVWIDTTSRKQESLGVTFPIGMRTAMAGSQRPQLEEQPGETQGRQIPNRRGNNERMVAATQKIKLTGFEGMDEITNTNEAIPGVFSGKIERDAMNIMQYTLVIPFERLPRLNSKTFTLGIKTGNFDMADMAAMRERMMAQGGRRPGGYGGNEMPEGRRPGGGFSPENMEAMSTPTELWIKNIQTSKNNIQ